MKMTVVDNTVSEDINSSPESDLSQDDEMKAKRGHVLTELLETERVYVMELKSILLVS